MLVPPELSTSLKAAKSIRYWPLAEVELMATLSFHTYRVFLTIVVGLPLAAPSLLTVVWLSCLP